MRIQHNISALNSHRNLGVNNAATSKNLEKLSSGYRINRAGDDAAGLAISEKMRGQIRGLGMAEQNTSMGINLIQTAEGGLNETHAILQRMRELAVQSSNGTFQEEDRMQLTEEFNALKSEIDRIATSTHYNGIKLLNGNLGDGTTTKTINTAAGLGLGTVTSALGGASDGDTLDDTFTFTLSFDATAGTAGEWSVTATGASTTAGTVVFDDDANPTTLTLTDANGAEFTIALDASKLVDGATFELAVEYTVDDGTASGSGSDAFVAAPTTAYDNVNATTTVTGQALVFQIGANGGDDQRVSLSVNDMSCASIGYKVGDKLSDGSIATEDAMLDTASIDTIDNANKAIDIITGATNMVSTQRAGLGALQNRLEHTLNNLGVTKENLTASESTIRDVDMASEMMDYTKNSILIQAAQAMLAQANQLPQGVLQLLQ